MSKEQDIEKIAIVIKGVCPQMSEKNQYLVAKGFYEAGYRPPDDKKEIPFDGNYHCGYCDKTFRIAD